MSDCQNLVNSYIEWLRKKISVKNIDGICEITTPFVDRHNDQIQIYVKDYKNKLILTDDGYTIRDLELSGVKITSEKMRRIFYSILNGFGVKLEGDELIIETTLNDFPQKKHNLVQAILAVNDLWTGTKPPEEVSFFKEEVENYLRIHEIRFTPSVKFTGKSGLDQTFDFVIPASRVQPERILKTISTPNRQNISLLIFSWTDIAELRPPNSVAYGVLNDDKKISKDLTELINALEQYHIRNIQWSRREEYVEELVS